MRERREKYVKAFEGGMTGLVSPKAWVWVCVEAGVSG